MNVVIHTDGSCINNGFPNASAGWSVIVSGDVEETLYGKVPGTQTNNRAELYGVLKALEWVKDHPEVKASLYSDSRLAIEGLLGESSRKANRDIWEQIEDLAGKVFRQITHIERIDREENKEADELAKKAANALFIL